MHNRIARVDEIGAAKGAIFYPTPQGRIVPHYRDRNVEIAKAVHLDTVNVSFTVCVKVDRQRHLEKHKIVMGH